MRCLVFCLAAILTILTNESITTEACRVSICIFCRRRSRPIWHSYSSCQQAKAKPHPCPHCNEMVICNATDQPQRSWPPYPRPWVRQLPPTAENSTTSECCCECPPEDHDRGEECNAYCRSGLRMKELALSKGVTGDPRFSLSLIDDKIVENRSSSDFVAALVKPNYIPFCTGSIITAHFVLTACQRCLTRDGATVQSDDVKIQIPDLKVSGIIYDTQRILLHPKCLSNHYRTVHDLGLIQTKQQIQANAFGKVAKTHWNPDRRQDWTLTSYNAVSIAPTSVAVSILDVDLCRDLFNSTLYNEKLTYCTPYLTTQNADHFDCQRDYGSPLSLNGFIVGVQVQKLQCEKPGAPGIFVTTAHSRKWIQKTVLLLSGGTEDLH